MLCDAVMSFPVLSPPLISHPGVTCYIALYIYLETPALKLLCYFNMKWQVGIWFLNGSQLLWLVAAAAYSK